MEMVQLLWVIFSAIFLCLTLFHIYLSTRSIKKPQNFAEIKTHNGLRLGVAEFINYFGNEYISSLNKDNRLINIVAAIGYFMALLTSIFSYYLSTVPR